MASLCLFFLGRGWASPLDVIHICYVEIIVMINNLLCLVPRPSSPSFLIIIWEAEKKETLSIILKE